MSVLTVEQRSQVAGFLGEFDEALLKRISIYALGQRLERGINVKQGEAGIVAELIDWCERRGRPMIERLLGAALGARPANQQLREFCQKDFPGALQALNPAAVNAIIEDFNLGLQALIDMKDEAKVRETTGGFRADFEEAKKQIQNLVKYKALHDSLHDLQLRLETINGAIVLAKDAATIRPLGKYALELGRWAKGVRLQIPGLPSRQKEEGWLDKFDIYVRDLENAAGNAAKLAITPSDLEKLAKVPVGLRRSLQEAPRINGQLVYAATALRFDRLAESMEQIVDSMRSGKAAGDPKLEKLIKGSEAGSNLGSRLGSLVEQHNVWQDLNSDLELAEVAPEHQPAARFSLWEQFKGKLDGLCDVAPQEDWSRNIKDRMAKWIAATPSAEPGEAERNEGKNAFDEFRLVCLYRFVDVDRELKELSGEVARVAQPLDTLLAAIR